MTDPTPEPTPEPTFSAADYDRAADRMQVDTEQARQNWADATSDSRITADEEVALWAAHYARRSVLTAMLRFAARRARQTETIATENRSPADIAHDICRSADPRLKIILGARYTTAHYEVIGPLIAQAIERERSGVRHAHVEAKETS